MVTLVGLTALLLEKNIQRNRIWIKTPLDGPIAGLLALCSISTLVSSHRPTSFWALVQVFNYVAVYYLVVHAITTRSQLRRFVHGIIAIGLFLSVFGLVKYLGLNPFAWWDYTGNNSPSPSSTFGNSNHYAGYLNMVIPLALAFLGTGMRGKSVFLILVVNFVLLAGLMFSLSRGGWVSAWLSLAGMFVLFGSCFEFRRKKLYYLTGFGMLVFALLALSSLNVVLELRSIRQFQDDGSLISRIVVWKGVWTMILDHPLTGVGPGTFSTMFTRYQPPGYLMRFFYAHSDYLQFVSAVGLPLIPVMLWAAVLFLRHGFRKLRDPSRLIRAITLAGLTGVLANLIHMAIDFNLHMPANALLFTVIIALVMAPVPRN